MRKEWLKQKRKYRKKKVPATKKMQLLKSRKRQSLWSQSKGRPEKEPRALRALL